MKTSYVLLFLFFTHFSFCQTLTESFSDNDFLTNPEWQGDTSYYFINSAGNLQSRGPANSATISLSTASNQLKNTIWEFYTKIEFQPSTANYAKVYLASDNVNLEGSLKGYFVKIGGETGTTDGIDLYKQNGTVLTKIIDGIAGHAGKSLNSIRVKVSRDSQGNWMLYSDINGNQNYTFEGSAFDSTYTSSSYFGISCIHSSTRKDQFFFDDFIIREAPISIDEIEAENDTSFIVKFNKLPEPNSLQLLQNYELSGYGNPTSVVFSGNEALISFSKTLLPGPMNFILKLPNQTPDTTSFIFTKPLVYGDIAISEIYPDPSPTNGLPAEEFIELYNTTSDTIDLLNFTISDPATTTKLPAQKINPNTYLILTSSDGLPNYQVFGNTLNLASFPSLNNSSDIISLRNAKNKLIFQLNYSDSWYNNPDKKDGGWSLEMINLKEFCKGQQNWTSSENPYGGTPGTQNSTNSTIADTSAPKVVSIELLDSSSIQINLNEAINTQVFSLIEMTGNTIEFQTFPSQESIVISFKNQFPLGENINIIIGQLQDCLGNTSTSDTLHFMRPENATTEDIVINEILFNPHSGGIDFVEVVNRSGKYLDLKNWSLASQKEDGSITSEILFTSSHIIAPQSYRVFCTSRDILAQHYRINFPENIIELAAMPAYNDDKGTAILLDHNSQNIDRFEYSEDMHSPLLENTEGVSLERISLYATTQTKNNWYSASQTAGFATPGYENSDHIEKTAQKAMEISPKVISPNGDNHNDLVIINYNFPQPGNVCTLKIFNIQGSQINALCSNELLSSRGFFHWDGTMTNGSLVSTGTYIVLANIFNPNGESYSWKETITVINGF